MSNFNVIIVGSGLSGPLLASGLLATGVKVDLFEKLEAGAKRDGYQIRVAQPCMRAFRQNLSEDQCARITAKLGAFESNKKTTPIWYDHRLNALVDMGRISEEYHGSAPIDRVVLRDVIMERPLDKGIVHFGKSFQRYEIVSMQGSEKVRVFFEDGTSADCDIMIGADGSHSKINRQLGLRNIEHIPVINFIAKARLSRDKLEKLPAVARHAPMLCFSHRKTYFCVAYIPSLEPDSKTGKAGASVTTSEYDESAATFTFSMLLQEDECPVGITEADNETKWKFLYESISVWDDAFRQVIDVIKTEELYVFRPRASKRPALDWRSSVQSSTDPGLAHPRVWLMGDAMHVMLPNRGMGGNQAMLDTTVLLPLLERLHRGAEASDALSNDTIAAACKEYEHEMIPRTFAWVEASGGTSPVPFDTNTFLGRCTAWSLGLSLDIRDRWNAICRALGLK